MILAIRAFFERYRYWFGPGAFLVGFLWDSFTLQRIDVWFDHIVILGYLGCAAISIMLLLACDEGRIRGRFAAFLQTVVPLLMQFFFGGLFSVFFIFYARSGTWASSGIFLGMLAAMLVGNEFFHSRYRQFVFQMSIFFTALYAYAAFGLPVVLARMGAEVFLLSGCAALGVVGLFTFLLSFVAPIKVRSRLVPFLASVLSITVVFQTLYFMNLIPPVPLTMKEGGVYHAVSRTATRGFAYDLRFEPPAWYEPFHETSPVYHWRAGSPVYVYSAIFAPTKLRTAIAHRWSWFDEAKGEWVVKSRLGFAIVGGRDGGYRGYSLKHGVALGKWRVDVVTDRDQVIGRVSFTIVPENGETVIVQGVR